MKAQDLEKMGITEGYLIKVCLGNECRKQLANDYNLTDENVDAAMKHMDKIIDAKVSDKEAEEHLINDKIIEAVAKKWVKVFMDDIEELMYKAR